MNHLDLFSGIGGFALAAQWAGFKTVAFCEIEDYPRQVLAKNFPGVPIHRDIRALCGRNYEGIELLTAGYPCQPFSVSGKRAGEDDNRHLWPEVARLIREIRPTWFIGENVIGHITMGLDSVLSDLEGLGYTAETFVIPAVAVNAKHRRDRVWIIAYTNCERRCSRDTSGKHATDVREPSRSSRHDSRRMGSWDIEPGMGRVANGIPRRMDRLKGLGNAIVPQVAYQILMSIKEG